MEINSFATQATQELLREEHFLERGMRADKTTDGAAAMVLRHVAPCMCDVVEGDIPVDFLPLVLNRHLLYASFRFLIFQNVLST